MRAWSSHSGWHGFSQCSAYTFLTRSDIIAIQQPRAYGPRVRAALDASAPAVRLRDLVPYWYAMALRLANLCVVRTNADLSQTTCMSGWSVCVRPTDRRRTWRACRASLS